MVLSSNDINVATVLFLFEDYFSNQKPDMILLSITEYTWQTGISKWKPKSTKLNWFKVPIVGNGVITSPKCASLNQCELFVATIILQNVKGYYCQNYHDHSDTCITLDYVYCINRYDNHSAFDERCKVFKEVYHRVGSKFNKQIQF